jgi:polyhydroxyalkanoate synthesis regulator phasin
MISDDRSARMYENAASYLDRCREMDFSELLRFVEDSLERISEPDPAGDRPHTEEEFWHLMRMLREKGDIPKLEPVRWVYEPSEKLKSRRAKLERLRTRLKNTHGDPYVKKRDIQQMQERLPKLEREVASLASEEWSDHELRLAEYRREANDPRVRIVERVARTIDRTFRAQPTGRIQWQPLPPGEATPGKIRRHYEDRLRSEGRLDKFDENRLDKATQLPFVEWWVPTEEFGGFDAYSIFSFAHTEKVLLECPIYGNAAYIIPSGEESWIDKTKQQLIDSGEAQRIPHQGETWDAKVRQALDLE